MYLELEFILIIAAAVISEETFLVRLSKRDMP